MENLLKAVFREGKWENPKEFDTWKTPGKIEYLKMRRAEKDHSDIPSDLQVYLLINFIRNIILKKI